MDEIIDKDRRLLPLQVRPCICAVKVEIDITNNLMQENTIKSGRLLPLQANPTKCKSRNIH